MDFIDRKEEMARLDQVARSQEGGLVVLWGRRRIGKTRLLLEWSRKYQGVYYMADESTPTLQRKYFSLALDQVLPGFSSVDYPDWVSFFSRLARDAEQLRWRGPLVMDELPYLITSSPELPSILQKFIDLDAKKAKMIVALAGSSQRMMQGAVLAASAPLYGRASEVLKLGPISVGYLGDALHLKEPRDMIESYSIWGGIPRYWELVKNSNRSLIESIDQIVLDPMGPLNDEPNRILSDELPSAMILRPILDAIGLGAQRLSEIAARIGQPATSLGRSIQRLMELDLIQKEIPFGCLEHHSKKTLYKMKDCFLRFWFEVVAPRRSYFVQAKSSERKKWLKEHLQPIISKTWEDLCRQALPSLSEQWGKPLFSQVGRFWQGQNSEWDIVSKSMEGKELFVGEAKWFSKTPSASSVLKTLEEMKSKGFPPIDRDSRATLYYALFIPEKPKNLQLPPHVKVVDAEEVIQSFY